MKKLTQEELNEKLRLHKLWLEGDVAGKKAILDDCDMSYLSLCGASLDKASLKYASLYGASLDGASLYGASLKYASLYGASLDGASLYGASLDKASLKYASLGRANLSNATGLKSNIDFLAEHFEKNEEGYIAYKTFDETYKVPQHWKIEKGSVLNENVNFNRTDNCGCGINVAPIEWVKKNCNDTIWKCLIRWEWLAGVCCPYNSDGKIRCERIELIEPVEEAWK